MFWLKWFNDVMLGGGKVVGILVEMIVIGNRRVIIIGCGLNVN